MADLQEKKDKFSSAINHYAEEQREKIENEIEDYKRKELEEAEIEVLTECYQLIQKETQGMRNGIAREMAQREMDARRDLLEKRGKITKEVFQKATQKLKKFTGQEGYVSFLKKSAGRFAKIFGRPGIVVRLKSGDEKYEAAIREALGLDCRFETDASIKIGGLKAFHPEMGVLADESFDSLLEDQKSWFEKNSGMSVV